MCMEYKDYYKILEVDKNATQDEIKKSFRKLAKKYHPDLHPDDPKAQEKFKEINEAYEVLGDEDKRKKYDQFGQYGFNGGEQFDPSQFGFGNFQGGRTYTYTTDNMGDFSDFFNLIFGNDMGSSGQRGFNIGDIFGSRTSQRKQKKQKPNYESELTINLEEAYKGSTRDVMLNINGENKTITVKIPKGITEGKKVKVNGNKWGLDGDILFKINIKKDENIRLEGLDIYKKVKVYPWQAYFGDKIVVTTLDGKIRVEIPERTNSGKKMRLAKKGFVDLKGDKGDLYLEVEIVNPESMTKEQEELYRKLKEITNQNINN